MLTYLCISLCWVRLNVQGRRAVLVQSSSEESDATPGVPGGMKSHDRPKMIEAEGLMEEYLAFDFRDL